MCVLHHFAVHVLCVTNDGGTCTCRTLYPNCGLFHTGMLGVHVCSGLYLSTVLQLLYRIAENFQGRKLLRIGENTIFAEKTFADCSLLLCQRIPCPPILWRKLSRIAKKPQNSRKFSPSKVFRYTVVFVGELECWMHLSVTVCVLSFALYIPCCTILMNVVGGMSGHFMSYCGWVSV